MRIFEVIWRLVLDNCVLVLQVVVATHAYGRRSGVRYMTNGLKVYYIPRVPFIQQNALPTLSGSLPIIRTIIVREGITLVHGHQAFSTLCHESLLHARTMGLRVVFTDHSLYGFADLGSIHMNKVCIHSIRDCHRHRHSNCTRLILFAIWGRRFFSSLSQMYIKQSVYLIRARRTQYFARDWPQRRFLSFRMLWTQPCFGPIQRLPLVYRLKLSLWSLVV